MNRAVRTLKNFVRREDAGGLVLIASAVVALIWANSSAGAAYVAMLHLGGAIAIGGWRPGADAHFLVDDGLMALFFLLVGLEIRREITEGELASWQRAAAPIAAALGGMVVPAAIFMAFNWHDPATLRGWAIPIATDIAFSLTVLRLLGPRVPAGLRVFLTALAIIDDLGAILIIAVFYTDGLNLLALGLGVAVIAAMALLAYARRRQVAQSTAPYLLGLVLLWLCLVQSGVHATLAGVAVAMVIPMRGVNSPGHRLEHALAPWVAFLVLPLFGLFNAGLRFGDVSAAMLFDPLVAGIAIGLLVGKQVGVFGATWLAQLLGLAHLPSGLNPRLIYGASLLCGIGFTMSLFIGNLAFNDATRETEMKLAVLAASLLSALAGAAVLAWATRGYSASPSRR